MLLSVQWIFKILKNDNPRISGLISAISYDLNPVKTDFLWFLFRYWPENQALVSVFNALVTLGDGAVTIQVCILLLRPVFFGHAKSTAIVKCAATKNLILGMIATLSTSCVLWYDFLKITIDVMFHFQIGF